MFFYLGFAYVCNLLFYIIINNDVLVLVGELLVVLVSGVSGDVFSW